MRRVLILIISLFFSQFLASCAYKPDVQQGNTFDEKQLSQLKIGMTQQQVVFIMGTALLKDPFHKDRWDYLYTFAKNQGVTERRLVTLYFKNGRLSKIDDSQKNKIPLN
jgi:outer membrane protein assembly factor BamE (lipoprotein component of BamABCDE complex)